MALKVDGAGLQSPMAYRYTVTASPQVNSFRPKELAADAPKLNLRPAMFGALWHNRLHDLPIGAQHWHSMGGRERCSSNKNGDSGHFDVLDLTGACRA